MTTSPNDLTEANAGRIHTSLGLLMLGVVGGTCLLLIGLAHSESLKDWMSRKHWEQSQSKKSLPIFSYTDHFVDFEDRLVHEIVPSVDFSHGGVYFIGSSSMKWGLEPWTLPAETRPFIHNFGFGGSKHSSQHDFIQLLVREEGFLKTDPEKTLILIGTNYRSVHNGRLPGDGPSRYFLDLWTRHGFYTIETDGTIRRTPQNPLLEKSRLEPSRMTGFLRELVNLVYLPWKSPRVHKPKEYNESWKNALGPRWNEFMDSELGYLKNTLEDLKRRKAKVAIIRMPEASWEKDLPFQAAYLEKLTKICDSLGVKIYDYSKLLEDEEFADSNHFTPHGIEKFHKTVMELGHDHLRSAGLLPPNGPAKGP